MIRRMIKGEACSPSASMSCTMAITMSDRTKVPSEPLYKAMVADGVDYRPWESRGLGDDECFVCTKAIGDSERTTEDVIPKWILRKLRDLGTQRAHILLPNLTQIPVNRILLPTCRSCNGGHLSRIEKEVSAAFKVGPAAVRGLPEQTLRMWCTKIAYGLRRRDMQLASDRANPASPKLASKEDLESLWLLHMLLQETREVVHVPDGHSTFFVFESQTVGCNICDFDIAVPIGWPNAIMVRLGDVTLMGAVDDRGALDPLRSEPAFQASGQLKLHPIQVRALWAILVHRAHLLRIDRLPLRYGVAEQRLWIDRLPVINDPTDPSMERASADKILTNLIDSTDEVLAAHGGASGLLARKNGTPRFIPFQHGVMQLGAPAHGWP
jgi:hypothetical protein